MKIMYMWTGTFNSVVKTNFNDRDNTYIIDFIFCGMDTLSTNKRTCF